MNAVQLNTRVSLDFRDKGSRSFANAGFSLSEAIRIYLDFAARNINKPQMVKDALENMQACKSKKEIQGKIDQINHVANLLDSFCKQSRCST